MTSLLESSWNITVNLGIKCNALGISRQADVRYYSSPFDNIDTVDGLVNCGKLISRKFKGYFDSVDDWRIKNDIHRATNELRAKIKWHKDSPDIFYPHFYEAWIKGALTAAELDAWKKSLELDIKPVWNDLKEVFTRRQDRLIRILENPKNKVLFLRIDERRSLKRLKNYNTQAEFDSFIESVTSAFPGNKIGLLYLYAQSDMIPRSFSNSENFEAIEIPEDVDEEVYAATLLKQVNLLPKSDIHLPDDYRKD